jgi:hypothetical protein
MLAGQGLLAVLCLALGVLPTWVIGLIDAVPRQVLGDGLPQAGAYGWLWLTPVSPQTASYSGPLVVLMLAGIGLTAFWGLNHLWAKGAAVRWVHRGDAWDCGFAPPSPRMQYTATSFAQPIRRVFGLLFQIEESVTIQEDGSTRHRLRIRDRFWGLLYLPIARAVESSARRVVRLQSGNVRVYLGWTLATLVGLLWIIT